MSVCIGTALSLLVDSLHFTSKTQGFELETILKFNGSISNKKVKKRDRYVTYERINAIRVGNHGLCVGFLESKSIASNLKHKKDQLDQRTFHECYA